MKKLIITAVLVLCATMANAGWQSFLDALSSKPAATQSSTTSAKDLSSADMNSALKQALNLGVKYAVNSLGAKDGYLNNSLVKIGLPENLQTVANLVRKVGGDKYVDDLIVALNDAATQAAPKTAMIFADSIGHMTIEDARNILAGSENAATQYFRDSATIQLQATINPIVKECMSQNSVAKYYSALRGYYNDHAGALQNEQVSGLANSLGFGSVLPGKDDEDLDSYVTNKAIDGLMTMIAQKEQEIRKNPMVQTSTLIQKVFSAF